MLMRSRSAQLLLFTGDDLIVVNNGRASASNAQMPSISAISKCLELNIKSEIFQSFPKISNHPFTIKTKIYFPTISWISDNGKSIKWQFWTVCCKFESNTFSTYVTCSMKNGYLHGNDSLPSIRRVTSPTQWKTHLKLLMTSRWLEMPKIKKINTSAPSHK